jgi:hypothetical protein
LDAKKFLKRSSQLRDKTVTPRHGVTSSLKSLKDVESKSKLEVCNEHKTDKRSLDNDKG